MARGHQRQYNALLLADPDPDRGQGRDHALPRLRKTLETPHDRHRALTIPRRLEDDAEVTARVHGCHCS